MEDKALTVFEEFNIRKYYDEADEAKEKQYFSVAELFMT
jgi:hypothetical protein